MAEKITQKQMNLEAASLVLDAEAWDTYVNFAFEIWYDEKSDTFSLSNNFNDPVYYATGLTAEGLNCMLKSFNPFWQGNKGKETYTGIVKFTLESMFELAGKDPNYCLLSDLYHYYSTTIKSENVITADEYINLIALTSKRFLKGV